ncbi:uncharacterized protein LOC109827440 [Asparagus officinalis]|nr:uncharacterized protein LOC109827440 [Asparagus officinalis]
MSPFTERLVGETGRIHFVNDIQEMESLVGFRMHQLSQAQLMIHRYGAPQEPIPHADGPQIQDSENGVEDTNMSVENGDKGNLPPQVQDSENRVEDINMSVEDGDVGNLPPENGSMDQNGEMEE